ncbi:hypothetical protein CRYUN_Cryun18bG0047800 [Craigia yunnanensis]
MEQSAFPLIANLLKGVPLIRFEECIERWFVPSELQSFLTGDNRSQYRINIGQFMYYKGSMNMISSSRMKHHDVSLSNVSHVKAMYSDSTFGQQTENTFEKQGSALLRFFANNTVSMIRCQFKQWSCGNFILM